MFDHLGLLRSDAGNVRRSLAPRRRSAGATGSPDGLILWCAPRGRAPRKSPGNFRRSRRLKHFKKLGSPFSEVRRRLELRFALTLLRKERKSEWNELQELLVDGLRDIYDAEKQLVKGLPKMAKALTSNELKDSFNAHLEQTKNHVTRAEQCLELFGEKVKGKPCKAMKGLVEEAQEHLQEHEKGELLDQVLVGVGQKVEHYEIAAYGTARAIAKSLGNKEALNLLQETLREEEGQDKQLSVIAIRLQKGDGAREARDAGGRDREPAESSGACRGGERRESRKEQRKRPRVARLEEKRSRREHAAATFLRIMKRFASGRKNAALIPPAFAARGTRTTLAFFDSTFPGTPERINWRRSVGTSSSRIR